MAQEPSERTEVSGAFGKSRVGRVVLGVAIVGAVIIALVVLAGFFQEDPDQTAHEETPGLVSVDDQGETEKRTTKKRETWEERTKRFEEEAQKRREQWASENNVRLGSDGLIADDEDQLARERKKRRERKVRRFRWMSPAEERGRIWNVPRDEGKQSLATALLRVCLAEADGEPQDCVGIWQVLKNIRSRSCARGHVRRITECEEDGGETMLSTIRRAQPHILAVPTYKLRNARAGWIRNLETDCEMPKGWRHGENRWDANYGSKRCPQTVELVNHLIKNELPPPRPGARLSWLPGRPITWGGRCETNRASCDDRIACARGLARITRGPETTNAFWCRPGAPGCRRDAEPICVALGYGHVHVQEEEQQEVSTDEAATPSAPLATSDTPPAASEKNI